MANNITITASVSAAGFTWTPPDDGGEVDVSNGDMIDFQPSGPNPPTSVTVTVAGASSDSATALFGTAELPVPSLQTVSTDHGAFVLTAGNQTATLVVMSGGRPIDPPPPPDPRDHRKR